jgi:hypothetical protein
MACRRAQARERCHCPGSIVENPARTIQTVVWSRSRAGQDLNLDMRATLRRTIAMRRIRIPPWTENTYRVSSERCEALFIAGPRLFGEIPHGAGACIRTPTEPDRLSRCGGTPRGAGAYKTARRTRVARPSGIDGGSTASTDERTDARRSPAWARWQTRWPRR